MKRNMGTIDRVLRLLVVVVIAVLFYTDQLTGLAATILGIVAVAFLFTGIVGWCPGYLPFGISTRKRTE
jgi:dolichyl-phosphate-mannose--protein O-mannosyl transferase